MKRFGVIAIVLWAAPARAQEALDLSSGTMGPSQDPPIDVARYWSDDAYYDGRAIATPTEEELGQLDDLRLEAQRKKLELREQCDSAWARAGDDLDARGRVQLWMRAAVDGLRTSQIDLIRTVEALFPTETKEAYVAEALLALRDMHLDLMESDAQKLVLDDPALSPCEPGEVGDDLRYNHSYYAASAERAFVDAFPDDPRRDDALIDLVDLYADSSWTDAQGWALRQLLCPGAEDSTSYDQYGGFYGSSTVDYKTCTPTESLEGDDLLDAWLKLADLEHTMQGRRAAEIAARERAASVTGVDPPLGVWWELASTYLSAGMRVEAIPVLDELAQAAYADSTQVDLADQAVTKAGETLAQLWRESSLPTQDAALKLAQIYFHKGRRKHPHVRGIFVALAQSLRELGAYEQAVSVQREVIASWPLHPMAPQASADLVELELERGDALAAIEARGELVTAYEAGSKWAEINGADAAAVLVDDQRMAAVRGAYAHTMEQLEHHAGDADDLVYRMRVWLGRVIADSASPAYVLEAKFRLGEVQSIDGDGAGAAASFAEVVDALPTDAPLRHAAIAKLVRAREVALDDAVAASRVAMPGTNSLGEPPPRPQEVIDLRDSYDLLLTILDRSDEIAETLVSAAELDLAYGRTGEAEQALRTVVTDHCFTGSARAARDKLVALVTERDGATAAEEISKDVAARGCLDTAKALAARDKDLEKQLTKARGLVTKGDFAGAARLLDREYAMTPTTSSLADDVLLEAAQAWIGAGDDAAAARLLAELDTRPELAKSPKYVDLVSTRAQLAQRRLDWPAAAAGYLAVADAVAAVHKGKKGAGEEAGWVYLAAEMRAADHVWVDRGDEPGAISLYLQAARKAREVGVANAAWMNAAELAQRAGRRDQLTQIHAEWKKAKIDRDHDLVLTRMEAEAAEAAGDRKAAETQYRAVADKGAKEQGLGADAEDAVVAAKFWLGEEALRSDTVFKTFKWGKNQEEDQKKVAAIEQRMEELSQPFQEISGRSSRWRVAAAVRLADVLLAGFEAYVSAPPPEWLVKIMQDSGVDRDALTKAEGLRMLLQAAYRQVASQLKTALDEPRAGGFEKWVRLGEQRLAEIGPWADMTGGARTEVFVEELE